MRTEHWTTSATELPGIGEPLFLSLGAHGAQGVFDEDDVLSTVGLGGGGVYASVAAERRRRRSGAGSSGCARRCRRPTRARRTR